MTECERIIRAVRHVGITFHEDDDGNEVAVNARADEAERQLDIAARHAVLQGERIAELLKLLSDAVHLFGPLVQRRIDDQWLVSARAYLSKDINLSSSEGTQ